jgi:hypothetical protein
MHLMRVEIANDVEVCRSPPNRRGLTTCSYLLPVISMPSIQRLTIFSRPLAGKQSDGGAGLEPKPHNHSLRLRCNWQGSSPALLFGAAGSCAAHAAPVSKAVGLAPDCISSTASSGNTAELSGLKTTNRRVPHLLPNNRCRNIRVY